MHRLFTSLSALLALFLNVFSQDSVTTVYISSEPPGAHIFIDDQIAGSTPHTVLKILKGKHILKLTREGYEDWITTLHIDLSDSNRVHAILSPLRGKLQIECDLVGSIIYIDGKFVGRTPKIISDIELGKHYLEIRKYPSDTKDDILAVKDTIEITDINVNIFKVTLGKSWLSLDSNPSNSELLLDGKCLGILPFQNKEIQPGKKGIQIIREGFESADLEISFKPGEHKELEIDLIPMTYNKILFRSIVFPGLGQFYAYRPCRGYLYSVLEIGALGGIFYMESQRSDAAQTYLDKYYQYQNSTDADELLTLHKEVNESYDQAQEYQKYRNIFIGAALSIWIINIVDAHLLGKKIEQNNHALLGFLKMSNLYVQTYKSNYTIQLRLPL